MINNLDETNLSIDNKIQIVLISVGIFQKYILVNIEQLLKLNLKVHVITNKMYFKHLDKYKDNINVVACENLNSKYFEKKLKLKKGFWRNCSKRIFYLYEFIKKYNLKNIIHLENDVLLYNKLNFNFEEKIYLTMDSKNRCIPGIIYIDNYKLLNNLIDNYDFKNNDMINMAKFYKTNKDIVKTFPIIDDSFENSIYNENFKEFNSIFDGAAIGQYLGGVDPKERKESTIGFVNETCVIKYNKYDFEWILEDFKVPYIKINDKLIRINNLHIHCKDLNKFKF